MRTRKLIALVAVLALALAACGEDGAADTTEVVADTTEAAPDTTEAMTDTTEAMTDTTEAMTDTTATTTPATVGAGEQFTTGEQGVLSVCTDAPYPPMEFEENGEFTGFDIELMREIANQLGLELSVNNVGFDPITSGTAMVSGQCDIAAASITITEDREENIDFSDPYFTADQSLLVPEDSGVTTLEDLEGQSLGVQSGTTGEMYAQENAPEGVEIVSYDNPGDLFVALEAGDIGGILQDLVVNQGRTLEDDTVAVVQTYETDEEYGFAVKEEGSEALLAAVNDALANLMENGTYDAIYEEWFGQN